MPNIKKLSWAILGIFAVCFTFFCLVRPSYIDKAILLEDKNPGFMKCFFYHKDYFVSINGTDQKYLVFDVMKDDCLSATQDDIRLFLNYLKYQYKGYDGIAVNFQDGTGILNDVKTNSWKYGEMSQDGNITKDIADVVIVDNEIAVKNPNIVVDDSRSDKYKQGFTGIIFNKNAYMDNLSNITDMHSYLKTLKYLPYDIIITSGYGGRNCFAVEPRIKDDFSSLGFDSDKINNYQTYAGIVRNGKMIKQMASGLTDDNSSKSDVSFENINVHAGFDQSNITIDNVDYSQNNLGINIVIYNSKDNVVIDRCSFSSDPIWCTRYPL